MSSPLRVGAERFSRAEWLAETLRERVEDIDYVDLRFGEHVYVRPRAGSERNALAQAGPAVRRSKPAGE